jgi:thiol peroxidase
MQFSKKIGTRNDVVVLCISKDLPFTHHEFCSVEGIENIIMSSQYKNTSFSDAYPVEINSGAFTGLFSRAVIIVDEDGIITYTEQFLILARNRIMTQPLVHFNFNM